jgi:hypothetical protein
MLTTQAKKRSAADDESNPLRLAGILQHVLALVGPGHWYFIQQSASCGKICMRKWPANAQPQTATWKMSVSSHVIQR